VVGALCIRRVNDHHYSTCNDDINKHFNSVNCGLVNFVNCGLVNFVNCGLVNFVNCGLVNRID
jgi:transcription elongation factor Elf1